MTTDPDIADDDLNRICNWREDLQNIFNSMRRTGDCTMKAADEAEAIALEVFDNLHFKNWHRLREVSGSIEFGVEVGSRQGKMVAA